jgi:hypothetical protein
MNGNWLLLTRLTEQPIAGMPPQLQASVPGWLDYVRSDDDKQLLRLAGTATQVVGRATYVAPGVPAERWPRCAPRSCKPWPIPTSRAKPTRPNWN